MLAQNHASDAHQILVEANAQLNGLRNLMANTGDEAIHYLTAYQLDMLLQPATERVEKAIKLIELV